jgi:phage gp46-like protein
MSDAYIDPLTGDYAQADALRPGTLQRDPANGLANAVYLRITTPLGSWWADPTLGSRLHELQREKDTPRVERLAQQYCEQALQPLIDDGRVTSLVVDTQRLPGRLNVRVELVDAQGTTRTFDMNVKVG